MPTADYVIVGAGSAGCVLANRLSEDPAVRVLLLEAGGKDRSPNIKIPAAFANQFHTKLDWDYATEPEPHVDGRSLYIPRGKSLGGSSSMNAMLYVRGRPLDYDGWEAQGGAAGWGWTRRAALLPARPRTTRAAPRSTTAPAARCASSEQRSPRPLTERLLAASEAAGIPRIADYNGPEQDGASMFQVTQRNGRRWSAADAYLRPALKRPNLEVRHRRARCCGVELEGDRATGVRYRDRRARRAGRARRARGDPRPPARSARRSCCCSRASAPADDLRAVGVAVAPRPARASARNLQDHPFVDVHLGGLGPDDALRRRQAQAAGRVAAAPHRPADARRVAEVVAFVRTRGRACRPPTSSSTWAPPTSRTTARRSTTATAS